MRDIAEVVGRGLKVPVISASPEEGPTHWAWLAPSPVEAFLRQVRLPKTAGLAPTGPGLIADLEQMRYQ